MSHPAGLPDLFLDRSLGGRKVALILRAEGLRLETLSEHYGIPADEQVRDEEWLEYAGRMRLVVLMKDSRIRRNPVERAAVEAHEVRCFCISSQSITAEAMAARVLRHLDAIVKACAQSGPFIYAVHEQRLERVL